MDYCFVYSLVFGILPCAVDLSPNPNPRQGRGAQSRGTLAYLLIHYKLRANNDEVVIKMMSRMIRKDKRVQDEGERFK
jgi:hypothetical protein